MLELRLGLRTGQQFAGVLGVSGRMLAVWEQDERKAAGAPRARMAIPRPSPCVAPVTTGPRRASCLGLFDVGTVSPPCAFPFHAGWGCVGAWVPGPSIWQRMPGERLRGPWLGVPKRCVECALRGKAALAITSPVRSCAVSRARTMQAVRERAVQQTRSAYMQDLPARVSKRLLRKGEAARMRVLATACSKGSCRGGCRQGLRVGSRILAAAHRRAPHGVWRTSRV